MNKPLKLIRTDFLLVKKTICMRKVMEKSCVLLVFAGTRQSECGIWYCRYFIKKEKLKSRTEKLVIFRPAFFIRDYSDSPI